MHVRLFGGVALFGGTAARKNDCCCFTTNNSNYALVCCLIVNIILYCPLQNLALSPNTYLKRNLIYNQQNKGQFKKQYQGTYKTTASASFHEINKVAEWAEEKVYIYTMHVRLGKCVKNI